MKIMAVDDSNTMLSIAKKALTDFGYSDLVLCESGEIALDFLEKQIVDLILLDWHMPGLTGLDFLRIVKNSDHTKNIPVIMLTTEDHPLSIQTAKDSGADGYIIKPINAKSFQDAVGKISEKYGLQL